jgi:hypothetical protein
MRVQTIGAVLTQAFPDRTEPAEYVALALP